MIHGWKDHSIPCRNMWFNLLCLSFETDQKLQNGEGGRFKNHTWIGFVHGRGDVMSIRGLYIRCLSTVSGQMRCSCVPNVTASLLDTSSKMATSEGLILASVVTRG